jgi:hypothetical protein
MGIGICPSRSEIALLWQSCEIRLAACEIGFACEIFPCENAKEKDDINRFVDIALASFMIPSGKFHR